MSAKESGETLEKRLQIQKTKDVLTKLNLKRINQRNLNKEKLKVAEMEPERLIDYRRFDIMAKYIYGKFCKNKWNSQWGYKVYEEHLWVFNRYHEDDGTGKKGLAAFVQSFDDTLNSIAEDGFNNTVSLLPVSENGMPLDGAHRLAAALLYGKKVKTVEVEGKEPCYNYEFFKRKGLPVQQADAMAYEYCKLKDNVFILTLFPEANEKQTEIKSLLGKQGVIYYKKEITLEKQGLENLLLQLWENKEWTDGLNGDKKTAGEMNPNFFRAKKTIHVLVFETGEYEALLDFRKELNILFRKNNPFHLSSNRSETIRIAQMLLNENSIHFLNNRSLCCSDYLERVLEAHRATLQRQGADPEKVCLTGDTVLAAYGLKKAADLSFLNHRNTHLGNTDSGNKQLQLKRPLDDILFNPEHHFYYNGVKFSTLKIVKEIKKKEGVFKNRKDIRVISKLSGSRYNRELTKYQITKQATILKLQLIAVKLKCRSLIKKAANRMPVFR